MNAEEDKGERRRPLVASQWAKDYVAEGHQRSGPAEDPGDILGRPSDVGAAFETLGNALSAYQRFLDDPTALDVVGALMGVLTAAERAFEQLGGVSPIGAGDE